MITQHTLPPLGKRAKKRVGRGLGSGKGGHTVGRGQKGQKSREKVTAPFFGTKMKKSLLKRLPMQRGKGKLKSQKKPVTIPVGKLELFDNKKIVGKEELIKTGLLNTKGNVKIVVSGGKLTKALTVTLPVSSQAAGLIKKAGGNVS
ncbi:uL15 family ribosomal protein [Candidatus Microgenomates bacterium]|nr:uL15 family ribosomal protein [Candidatus Microgenomates bacterium]